MTHTTERIVIVPGYGEDPDMMQPFADKLSELVEDDIPVADMYRSGDKKLCVFVPPSA